MTKPISHRPAIAPAPAGHALRNALEETNWREPGAQARGPVVRWLHALTLDSLAARKAQDRGIAEVRARLVRRLTDEDPAHPMHPSQRLPKNCAVGPRRSAAVAPFAIRTWPDKVQALVAFDVLAAAASTPELVRRGIYAPVPLWRPRLTVVAITTEVAAQPQGFLLHFAERQQAPVTVESLLPATFAPSHPNASDGRRRARLAALRHLADLFAPSARYAAYLERELLPALLAGNGGQRPSGRRSRAETLTLPTLGVCDTAMLAAAAAALPQEAAARVAWLGPRIAAAQADLWRYIDSVRVDLVPEIRDIVPEPHSAAGRGPASGSIGISSCDRAVSDLSLPRRSQVTI